MTTDIRERVAEVLVRGHNNWMLSGGFPVDRESFQVSALLEAFPQLAEEPEWEYECERSALGFGGRIRVSDPDAHRKKCGGVTYRRRRAGHWEVIE